MAAALRLTTMAVNTDLVGHAYPPCGPFRADAGDISAFADVIGAHSLLHRDPEAARAAGFADVIAPPTFAVRFAQQAERQLIEDPAAGIDFSRVVHGEQRFVHERPIVAGGELTATLHVDQVRAVGGHAMVTSRCVLADAQGGPVCTAISMLVVRGED